MTDPGSAMSALLNHLREREETSQRIVDALNQVAARVERMDSRIADHDADVAKLDAAVVGTSSAPGLHTRVDRIEQAILFLRWIFGGGLVAATAAIVLLWKFGESLTKNT